MKYTALALLIFSSLFAETRIYTNYVLETQTKGSVRFTLSLPEVVPPEGLPTIVIIDGLKTGKDALDLIQNQGNYAIIAYEYAPIIKKAATNFSVFDIFHLRKALLSVPGRIVSLSHWASTREWSNGDFPAVMGFSFGALFIPKAYYIAQRRNLPLGPAVMAYGGADLYLLLKTNLPVAKPLRPPLAWFFAKLFAPLEPARYLPDIEGEFLIINGTKDDQIPLECARKLQQLTPEPKTIMNLDTGHLEPTDNALLRELIDISRKWLETKHPPA